MKVVYLWGELLEELEGVEVETSKDSAPEEDVLFMPTTSATFEN